MKDLLTVQLPHCMTQSSSSSSAFFLTGRNIKFSFHFILHVLRSCAFSLSTPFSFTYFRITSLHFSFGLPIFRCPPTSIFSLLTPSSCVFLSTFWPPNHLASVIISSLMFATPSMDLISWFLIFSILFNLIIHLNILISVLSRRWAPFTVVVSDELNPP